MKKSLRQPDITLREIRPNVGIEARYRKHLQDMLARMAADLQKQIKRVYHPAAEQIGMDDDPVVTLRGVLRRHGKIWTKRFDRMSADVAAMFATRNQQNLDIAFRKRLKDAGFTVKFRPTERMTSAYRVVVAENVNLIKSIPQQYLKDVESSVWANVMRGSDLHALSKDLREKYGVSARRAALISMDQNSKARALFESTRRQELGITQAIWKHSRAGKSYRPSHVKMDGQKFDVGKGMWDPDAKQWIQPGMLINCRCTSRSVLPGR